MYLADFARQNQVLLLSVGFGSLLGVVYDLFRLVRLAVAERKRGVFLQDLLFFAVAAFLTVLFLLVVNCGSLRLFILFAMAAGFFVYYVTLSRLILRIGMLLFPLLRRLVSLGARAVSAPLRLLLRFFAFLRKCAKKHQKEACKNSDM